METKNIEKEKDIKKFVEERREALMKEIREEQLRLHPEIYKNGGF